jgi:hypothetical protein
MGLPEQDPRVTVRRRGPADPNGRAILSWMQRAQRGSDNPALDLCGYILKKDSPSCGLMRVKVRGEAGMPTRTGRGLFADALVRRFPRLPVEEEGRLCDPRLRESFVERIFAYARLKALFTGRWTVGALVTFRAFHRATPPRSSGQGRYNLGACSTGT